MKDFLSRIFRLRSGEAGIVLVLSFLLLANSIAGEISGIMSISNFVEEGGINGILLVWLVDMLLMLLMTGLQSLFIDRFDRLTIMRWMTLGFVMAFVILRLFFVFGAPGWLNYGIMFLLSTQQLLIFPLFFWILANDVFDMAQTKRLFPLIAGWGFIGSLAGIGFTAVQPGLFERAGVRNEEVLAFTVLIYLLIYIALQTGFRKVRLRKTVRKSETMRQTLTEGWGFVREVPSFRYLTLAILALALCDVVIEFRFLAIADALYPDPARYQQFYSLYRLGFILVAFAIQTFLTSRIINRVGLKNTFLVLPFTAFAGAVWMTALPGIVSGVGGMLLQKLPQNTVDESARKALQALVPEERRGRVSIFVDSYLYTGGSIVGVIVTLTIVLLGIWLGIANYFYVYLAVAAAAALFAIWAIFKMRTVYDSSLFNWRLKRRQRRASVLDKLDF